MGISIKRSISKDLAIGLSIMTIILVTIIGTAKYNITYSATMKELNNKAALILNELADILGDSIYQVNIDSTRQVCNVYMKSDYLVGIQVKNSFDEVLFETLPTQKNDLIIKAGTILKDNDNMGHLKLWFTSKHIKKQQREVLLIMIVIIHIVVIVIMLGTHLILRLLVNKPLDQLTQGIKVIASGDYATTLPPVAQDDINVIVNEINIMASEIDARDRALKDANLSLEHKVEERTKDLNRTLEQVKEANEEIREVNRDIMESIRYAEMIQRSMLPAYGVFKTNIPDSFVIWMPRDIVGGDIVFADFFTSGIIVALVDCTGHGVPGAFMSMIASSGLRKIVSDEGCLNPAEILKRLNYFVQKSLQQDSKHAESDDGMDVAVCYFNKREQTITFAGARQPIFLIDNDELTVINGDRQSIGYKNSTLDFTYTNHVIRIKDNMCFYLTTDGFIDQLGGERHRMFGKKRLKELLLKNHKKPFDIQQAMLIKAFTDFKGNGERQDDVTLLGCSLTKYKQTVILIADVTFADSALDNKTLILDQYLKKITPDIKNQSGYINDKTLFSIMIYFPNDPDAAINTSIMMQEKLRELQGSDFEYANGISSIRTGIHTCTLPIKSFKELEVIDYDIMAEEIRLTSRLSKLNSDYGTTTLICDTTFSKLGNIVDYNHRFIGKAIVKPPFFGPAAMRVFSSN